MNRTVVAFALLIGTACAAGANGPTSWERYLETLDPKVAAETVSLDYSGNRSSEERLADLMLLQTQVAAGDVHAYRLALRFADRAQPGETLEVLAEMVSRLVRVNPKLFLQEQVGTKICFGVKFLGASYVDRPQAVRRHEINKRIEALESVKEPALKKAQESCIAALR